VTLGQRPYRWRAVCLVIAALWGVLAMVLVLTLQVNPAHVLNEQGQPVTHTVFSDQPVLWVANFVGIALVLVVAALELLSRARLARTAAGSISLVLGSILCLYSLFGLGYGIAAIAPIGGLVIASGSAVSRSPAAAAERA